MCTIDQIKTLFSSLYREEQLALLKELNIQTNELSRNDEFVKSCPYCNGDKVIRYGKAKGEQRYLCKNCQKIYKETTGTAIDKIQKKQAFLTCQDMIINEDYMTISQMAGKLNVSSPTVFAWRHKILLSLPEPSGKFEGETEMDDLWFGYSQKGRKGLDYSKKRGGVKQKGDNNFQVKVLTTTNSDHTDMKVAKIGRLSKADIQRTMGDKFTKKTILISDKHPSISGFTKQNDIPHIDFKASEHTNEEGKGVQALNNMAGRLDTLLNRTLRGVSTKYLQLYVNWFKTKENIKSKNIDVISIQKHMLSQKHTWDLYTNLEKVYERFINNHSERTYRCPVKRNVKAQNWNQSVIFNNAFI